MLNVRAAHKLKKKCLKTHMWYIAYKPVWEKITHGAILKLSRRILQTDVVHK